MKRRLDIIQHKAASLDAIERDSRTVEFIASDETVDSYGDIIRAKDWNLERFRSNPVLLWGHKSGEPPIGTVPKVWIDGTKLMARAKFLEEGVSDFADKIWRIVAAGALRAVSVGFWPTLPPVEILGEDKKWTGGFEWVGQELMELSVVCVPANPNALIAEARAAGMTPEQMKRWTGVEEVQEPIDVAGFRANLDAKMRVLSIGASRR
jgi:prohead serine protease